MDFSHVNIVKLLLDVLVSGLIVFVVSKVLPGISVKNFSSAIAVAIVYGILNALITLLFNYFGLTSITRAVSQGLFQVVFNAVLLMITDRMIEGFYVKNFWFALLGAFCISLLTALIEPLYASALPVISLAGSSIKNLGK
jgi:putative membrane protein